MKRTPNKNFYIACQNMDKLINYLEEAKHIKPSRVGMGKSDWEAYQKVAGSKEDYMVSSVDIQVNSYRGVPIYAVEK